MVLPSFSLRTGIAILSAAAVVSIVLREAWVGSPWALGALVGLAGAVVLLLWHAVLYGLARLLAGRRASPGPVRTGDQGPRT